jgi:methylmalonyl-CoA mutase C-terminal domain/subunit
VTWARALIAKVGLDGHDVGARAVARGLRDAGVEVVYTGIRQSPQMIVSAVLQEDVDLLGISILSGAHLHYIPRVLELLREAGADDVLVIVGGVIPSDDVPALLAAGVSKVFHAGTRMTEIVSYLQDALPGAGARRADQSQLG